MITDNGTRVFHDRFLRLSLLEGKEKLRVLLS
jgi:hypothetical protein